METANEHAEYTALAAEDDPVQRLGKLLATAFAPGHPAMHDWERVVLHLQLTMEECSRLRALVDSPQTHDFLVAVQCEKAHQVHRWGLAHDRSKSAENWFWLVGYLAGKALRATITGDREKALHHCVSSAAALGNWFDAIQQDKSGSGQGADLDLERKVAPAEAP